MTTIAPKVCDSGKSPLDANRLNEFEFLLKLGKGAFGTVFKAKIKLTGEFVAVK